MPLVSDKMIEAAFDYLHEQGEVAAQAKADLIIAEYRRKKTRAQIILDSIEKTIAMREAEAECHPDYEEACVTEARCAKSVEWHRHQLKRAEAVIEAWRSEQANFRGLGRAA